MNCVKCNIDYALPPLVCLCFFPAVFHSSSRVTGACPVITDLIMRGNVRTTTTTTTTTTYMSCGREEGKRGGNREWMTKKQN